MDLNFLTISLNRPSCSDESELANPTPALVSSDYYQDATLLAVPLTLKAAIPVKEMIASKR